MENLIHSTLSFTNFCLLFFLRLTRNPHLPSHFHFLHCSILYVVASSPTQNSLHQTNNRTQQGRETERTLRMLDRCLRPLEMCFGGGGDDETLLWDTDLKPHASGNYSIAVVQANSSLEDQAQVFTSPSATFVGVYDGHGGPQASRFITNHLFSFVRSKNPNLIYSVSYHYIHNHHSNSSNY